MNQDLQNYINQARAVGKTDEIIKQELASAGWQESDVSEAFGINLSPVSLPMTATVSTGAIISIKVLISIIVAIVIVGGSVGAYFVFRGKSGNPGGALIDKNQNLSTSLRCKNLLPDSDFERITGKKASDYQIVAYPFTVDDPTAIAQYYCKYVTNEQYTKNVESAQNSSIKISDINLNVSVGGHEVSLSSKDDIMDAIGLSLSYDYEFNILYYPDKSKSASDYYRPLYSAMKDIANGQGGDVQFDTTLNGEKNSMTFQSGENGSVTGSAGGQQREIISKKTVIDISGIGSAAYLDVSYLGGNNSDLPPINILYVLSSDKRFIIQLANTYRVSASYDPKTYNVSTQSTEIQSPQVMEEFAKAIDANLNKY